MTDVEVLEALERDLEIAHAEWKALALRMIAILETIHEVGEPG